MLRRWRWRLACWVTQDCDKLCWCLPIIPLYTHTHIHTHKFGCNFFEILPSLLCAQVAWDAAKPAVCTNVGQNCSLLPITVSYPHRRPPKMPPSLLCAQMMAKIEVYHLSLFPTLICRPPKMPPSLLCAQMMAKPVAHHSSLFPTLIAGRPKCCRVCPQRGPSRGKGSCGGRHRNGKRAAQQPTGLGWHDNVSKKRRTACNDVMTSQWTWIMIVAQRWVVDQLWRRRPRNQILLS